MLLFIIALKSNSEESISITKKNTSDPSIVCNESKYSYTATLTGLDGNKTYRVMWKPTNGIEQSTSISEAEIKWEAIADADGYLGSLYATLQEEVSSGTWEDVEDSNTINITIKSIKHLKPDLSPNFAGQWNLSPCTSGSQIIDATDIIVPGTEGVNPESVYIYEWVIPSGWSLNGLPPSDGSTPILGGKSVTLSYSANHIEGTIKARGKHTAAGCSD